MKILIDSSTLYSAIAHSGKVSRTLNILIEEHTIVISDYIAEEINRNFEQKLSEKNKEKALIKFDAFLSGCSIIEKDKYLKHLNDAKDIISKKDAPVLACGMLSEIDILLTSDKEFWEIESAKVKILSPKDIDEILL